MRSETTLDYERKKTHYQADQVASEYDAFRWSNTSRRWSNRRKLSAILRAIEYTASHSESPIRTALDLPCGTGRIFPVLFSKNIRVVGGDLSMEMMGVARTKTGDVPLSGGFIRCDVVSLPFSDDRFDAVFSIRFLFHLPSEVRRQAIKEIARVSRKWVIVDYRHRYTLKYRLKSLQGKLGFPSKPFHRLSKEEIIADFKNAGLRLVKIFPTFPFFSDKWVILAQKIDV